MCVRDKGGQVVTERRESSPVAPTSWGPSPQYLSQWGSCNISAHSIGLIHRWNRRRCKALRTRQTQFYTKLTDWSHWRRFAVNECRSRFTSEAMMPFSKWTSLFTATHHWTESVHGVTSIGGGEWAIFNPSPDISLRSVPMRESKQPYGGKAEEMRV